MNIGRVDGLPDLNCSFASETPGNQGTSQK